MTDRAPASVAAALLAAVLLLCIPERGSGQAPLFLVNQETRVASLEFRFPGGRTLDRGALRRQLALEGPGIGYHVRSVLGVLPLVSSPDLPRFHPPSLLRDVRRLRRFYEDAGFLDPEVTYDAVLDTTENRVEVTFVIREGRPLVLDTVQIRTPRGGPLGETLPDELRAAWADLEGEVAAARGRRLGASLRARLRDRVTGWLRDRGYPYPTASLDTAVVRAPETDEAERGGVATRALLTVDPGARMRVGQLRVDGNRRLSEEVVRREVPLNPGDWYSRARLAEGQSELFGLDLVRIATTSTEPDSTAEDRVDVRIRVGEGALHLVSGRAGYGATSGVSADASWSHRDFLGGGRRLEVSTVARTGLWAPEATAAERYGLSVTLRQPWLLDHRVEGLFRPFLEYRDDLRDESVQWGAEASALFRRGPRRNVSLRYSLSSRRVLDAGTGVLVSRGTDLPGLVQRLDTLDLDRRTSSLAATGRWARAPRSSDALEERGGVRSDWSVFGSVEVATPPRLSTVEYVKVVAEVSGLLPLTGAVTVRGRLGGGRVLPFGVSIPAPDGSDRLEAYLRLRDAVLTAGGSQDVRGWGSELLGPKAPDLRTSDGDPVATGRYLPLGGLARWTGSVQVEAPLPLIGSPHGLHAFLDAGRVWTPDGRFLPATGPVLPGQLGERVRYGTGLGVSVSTPVGPVQLDVGYKLNPSVLDLRDPGAVGEALLEGRTVESVPEDPIRRWHLHLSIGGVS